MRRFLELARQRYEVFRTIRHVRHERNHGLMKVGRAIGEAFNWMRRLELSCRD